VHRLRIDIANIRACYDRDVSELPDLWTPERPSTGCCHVTALTVHARHGGQIVRAEALEGQRPTQHYINVLDGIWIDATEDQFTNAIVTAIADATHEVLNEVTLAKWALLTLRLEERERLTTL
jgi:hypothetical protein